MSDHINTEFFMSQAARPAQASSYQVPVWARATIIVLLSLVLWAGLWQVAQSCTRIIVG